MTLVDEFYRRVSEEFGVDQAELTPMTKVVGDLGFDSLDVIRLAMVVDELCPGYELPEDFDINDMKLGDVLYYVENHLSQQRG